MEKKSMSDREMASRYLDLIDEADMPEVKKFLQQYAARTLNRQYMEQQREKAAR